MHWRDSRGRHPANRTIGVPPQLEPPMATTPDPREIPGQVLHPARDPIPDQPIDPVPDQPVDPVPDQPIDPVPDQPVDPDPERPSEPVLPPRTRGAPVQEPPARDQNP